MRNIPCEFEIPTYNTLCSLYTPRRRNEERSIVSTGCYPVDTITFHCGTGRQYSKVIIDSLNVVGIDIKPSTSVRNLGLIIDQDLALKEQVNALSRSCYGHLRSIIQTRPYLTKYATHIIVQSLISSRLDYCNSLLAELPQYLIHKLQKVQNCAARIV